jgi:hypothetical protein
MNTAQAVNGEIRPGDWVIVNSGAYQFFTGQVMAIVPFGTPEHQTGNDTTDVYVDFSEAGYTNKHLKRIEKELRKIGEDAFLNDLEGLLYDVLLAPDQLLRITGIRLDMHSRIIKNRETAKAFCEALSAAKTHNYFSG